MCVSHKLGEILVMMRKRDQFHDLINCQEGRDEFLNCQVGNEMRSLEDIIDC
jgi:hypothetical protein